MAKKKKAIKKQTLNEFKAWLEGVEELQTDNWAPDKAQWDKIRTRIENIKPDELTIQPAGRPPENPMFATPTPMPMPAPAPMLRPAVVPEYDISPAAQAMLNGAPPAAAQSGKPFEVDASQGPVSSGFE